MLENRLLPPDFRSQTAKPAEWMIAPQPVPYPKAVAAMEARVNAIASGQAPEAVWLVEHPPLYTAGTSAKPTDLLTPNRFPVFESGRGGQYTYHGPGQRVAYVMLDLKSRKADVRAYVQALEDWLIATLADFGVKGEKREGRVGIWVRRNGHEDKIAALGIRLRKWVSFHGTALNVNPDLSHFDSIVPCGVREHGVISLHALGIKVTMSEVDEALRRNFEKIFGATVSFPAEPMLKHRRGEGNLDPLPSAR